MSTLVTTIGELVTCDGTGEGGIGARPDQALVVADGVIVWTGPVSAAPACPKCSGARSFRL